LEGYKEIINELRDNTKEGKHPIELKSKAFPSTQKLTKLEKTIRKTKQGLIVSILLIAILVTAIVRGVFHKGYPYNI